jgi:hypothetical protein
MRIGRWNRSTRKRPAPVLLLPPQIPHDLTWARTRAAAVGSRRLTSWAMARHCEDCKWIHLAQNNVHCRAFILPLLNVRNPTLEGSLVLSEWILSCFVFQYVSSRVNCLVQPWNVISYWDNHGFLQEERFWYVLMKDLWEYSLKTILWGFCPTKHL